MLKHLAYVVLLSSAVFAHADEPKFVVTGGGSEEKEYKVGEFDRIILSDNEIKVTSQTNPAVAVALSQGDFSIIKFLNGNAGVDVISSDGSRLRIEATDIIMEGSVSSDALCTVYDLDGRLMSKGKFSADGRFSINGLASGGYVAIAVIHDSRAALKFIVK